MPNENKTIWSSGKCVTEKFLNEFAAENREEIPAGTNLIVLLEKPSETRAHNIGQIKLGENPTIKGRSDIGETEYSAHDNYEKSFRSMKYP